MKPVKDAVFEINGKKIDYAPGKFKDSQKDIEAMYSEKKFSFIDLIIPSAHADDVVIGAAVTVAVFLAIIASFYFLCLAGILVTMIAGLAAFAGGLSMMAGNATNDREVASLCDVAREKWNTLAADFTQNQLFEVKKAIVDMKSKLTGLPECIGGDKERMAICNQAQACLENLRIEAAKLEGRENSSRGIMKDINGSRKSDEKKKDASEQ